MALGTTELWVIGGIVVLLFGSTALVKWAKALREAKKEFERPITYEKNESKV